LRFDGIKFAPELCDAIDHGRMSLEPIPFDQIFFRVHGHIGLVLVLITLHDRKLSFCFSNLILQTVV